MNYRMTAYILGQLALFIAGFMLIPFIIALVNGENTLLAFGVTIGGLTALGCVSLFSKPKDTSFNARGGFLIVALAWIGFSVVGCLPFFISGYIPNFIDALFETVSGFTTTGASILTNIEALPDSLLFWRSFTHWIGGMGVLLFVIAILPKGDVSIVHVLKAEVPGPQFGKIVSKMNFTARILYAIYIVLTLLEVILLCFGGMTVFDSFIHAFGTAGTGGFSNYAASVGHFDSLYIDIVITVFMLVFSVNFNLYFLIIIGRFKDAIKSEELRWLLIVFCGATLMISLSLTLNDVYDTFWQALRYASFQSASILSTTGYVTADFATWPVFTQVVLVLLMFIGGCAGSTAGGLKVSRVMILVKNAFRAVKKEASPRSVVLVKTDKHAVSEELNGGVLAYFVLYVSMMLLSVLLVSAASNQFDFTTNLTAVVTCYNNVGPGLGGVGPTSCFYAYGGFSKIILILDMLMGRLEVLPILMIFYPKAWRLAK